MILMRLTSLLLLGSVACEAISLAPASEHPTSEVCDLCARSWVFIVSTGRSGSTSLLEALNSLPGVYLSGENRAALLPAMEMYIKAKAFANTHGAANEHNKLSLNSVLCSLQETFLALDPSDTADVRGFKELVVPTSIAAPVIEDKDHHAHFAADRTDWLEFLETLFPCAKIVFNLRADVASQSDSAFYGELKVPADELSHVNKQVMQMHEARGGNRTFLMRLEDFSAAHFTKMAAWLGFPECHFTSLPHANDASTDSGKEYHFDYTGNKANCTTEAMLPSENGEESEDCTALSGPCAPAQMQLAALSSQQTSKTGSAKKQQPLTFYLHHEGPFAAFDANAECFFFRSGITPGNNSIDDYDNHMVRCSAWLGSSTRRRTPPNSLSLSPSRRTQTRLSTSRTGGYWRGSEVIRSAPTMPRAPACTSSPPRSLLHTC